MRVCSTIYSVLVNGEICGYFDGKGFATKGSTVPDTVYIGDGTANDLIIRRSAKEEFSSKLQM